MDDPRRESLIGLAHVATVSFLASRLTPSGQFWAALAGGIALARAGAVHGLRAGYGSSCAAMVETVALIGPARVNGPLTQALNAPLVGRLEGRGAPFAVQFAACLVIRLAHYVALGLLFVWLVVGGIDAYVDTYDEIAGFLGFLPTGAVAAIVLTIAGNLAVAAFYSAVQVLVYRRALRRWPEGAGISVDDVPAAAAVPARATARARAVAVALLATWVLLLAWPVWPVLAAVGAATAVVAALVPARRRAGLRLGLALGLVLGLGALGPAVVGVVDYDDAVVRAVRALLLVLTAACARAALGADGVRALAASILWVGRAVPGAREAARLTPVLRSDRRLAPAGRDLVDRLRPVRKAPLPVADALSDWVAAEAGRALAPRAGTPARPSRS